MSAMKNGRVEEIGRVCWYLDDVIHRDDDLPACEYDTGHKCWVLNGKRHRDGNPACIDEAGSQFWLQNGKHHRLDGPAIEHINGESNEWWVNGKILDCKTQAEFEKLMRLKAFW